MRNTLFLATMMASIAVPPTASAIGLTPGKGGQALRKKGPPGANQKNPYRRILITKQPVFETQKHAEHPLPAAEATAFPALFDGTVKALGSAPAQNVKRRSSTKNGDSLTMKLFLAVPDPASNMKHNAQPTDMTAVRIKLTNKGNGQKQQRRLDVVVGRDKSKPDIAIAVVDKAGKAKVTVLKGTRPHQGSVGNGETLNLPSTRKRVLPKKGVPTHEIQVLKDAGVVSLLATLNKAIPSQEVLGQIGSALEATDSRLLTHITNQLKRDRSN